MTQPSREPDEFDLQVAQALRRLQPNSAIELTGPRELVVDGRRLDLENLYRLTAHDPSRRGQIVDHYLEQLFSGEAATVAALSFDMVRARIMPRIQPQSIFKHLDRAQVAHVPFVNGTVLVFVIDMPLMTVSVTTEQSVRWGVSPAELETLARENLREHSSPLELQMVTSREGGRAAIISQQDGYDAARVILAGLHRQLAPRLGQDFYVATPARDMFVALSLGPDPFVHRLSERVNQDFLRMPYPIIPSLFLVTRDGVAGTVPGEQDELFEAA